MENQELNNLNTNLEKPPVERGLLLDFNRPRRRVFRLAVMIIVAAVLVSAGIIYGTNRSSDISSMDNQLENNTNQAIINWADYPDYGRLAQMKKLTLAQDKVSWTPASRLENDKIVNLSLQTSGQLANAYLYAKLAVEDKALTKYDSFYIKFNNLGGHLYRPSTLALPPAAEAFTELLYPLEKIDYLPAAPYDESKTSSSFNAAQLFSPDSNIKVYAFISSWRPGKILALDIYYDCQTDSDCDLIPF